LSVRIRLPTGVITKDSARSGMPGSPRGTLPPAPVPWQS
jgi:hypothetical protein